MENFLLRLEAEFYFITGIYFEGLSGLALGLLLFSLTLILIRYKREQKPLVTDTDISNEIGNDRNGSVRRSQAFA